MDNLKEYLEQHFRKAYFQGDENKIKGINISHPVNKKVEDEAIIKLNKGEIDEYVVAWKAGRINDNKEIILTSDGDYINGFGRAIKKGDLQEYLKNVREKWKVLGTDKDFYSIYEKIHKGAPDNFGCVYIINLIFFLSKGEWPIYDKFAHKAAKALVMKRMPCEIFVGEAPDKKNVVEAVNMYMEYVWLLKKLFDTRMIPRELDQSLWVLGHANKDYFQGSNEEDYEAVIRNI